MFEKELEQQQNEKNTQISMKSYYDVIYDKHDNNNSDNNNYTKEIEENNDNDEEWQKTIREWEIVHKSEEYGDEGGDNHQSTKEINYVVKKPRWKILLSKLLMCMMMDRIEDGICLTKYDNQSNISNSLPENNLTQEKKTNNMKRRKQSKMNGNDVKRLFHLDEYDNILLNIDHIKEIHVLNSYQLPSNFEFDFDLSKKTKDNNNDYSTVMYEYILKSCMAEDALLTIDKPRRRKRFRKICYLFRQLMIGLFKWCKL